MAHMVIEVSGKVEGTSRYVDGLEVQGSNEGNRNIIRLQIGDICVLISPKDLYDIANVFY